MRFRNKYLQEAYEEGLSFHQGSVSLKETLDYYSAFGNGGWFVLAYDEQDGPYRFLIDAQEAARREGLAEFEIEHRPTAAEMLEAFEAGLRDAR